MNIEEAKSQFKKAGQDLMKTETPRNTNRAWSSVAMNFSEQFMMENYAEFQRAFSAGMVSQP